MKGVKLFYEGLRRLSLPVRRNALFFTFMFILLYVTLLFEKMEDLHALYYTELFFDLYMLCGILYLLPRKTRRWVRLFFYFVGYTTTIVEAFTFARFGLRFSPIMMQLCVETNPDEASEFFGAYIWSKELWEVTYIYGSILILNTVLAYYGKWTWPFLFYKCRLKKPMRLFSKMINIAIPIFFAYSVYIAWAEKERMYRFIVVQEGTTHAEGTSWLYFYSPFYRLIYSTKFLTLSKYEIKILKKNMRNMHIDSCSYRCPNIVLIIGESYNKRHAHLYGYPLNTTPYQSQFAKNGTLVPFSDVITPWNVTSNAFKSFLSTHNTDSEGSWADGVLFPSLFKKAGYKVAFITNQFTSNKRQSSADFNGSFFLNDEELDSLSFDYRNTKRYTHDKGLITEFKHYQMADHNLIIFHLLGQHLEYDKRFRKEDIQFTVEDIKRPDLTEEEKQIIADYDNATLYNDWVIARIYSFFKDKDAIVVYMPDHGDEVYDEIRTFGRNHKAAITPPLARAEFEIPFTIWFSRKFRRNHPEIVKNIRKNANQPFAIDDLPHLMLGLAGIYCPQYDQKRDLFNEEYSPSRKRWLKQTIDYDSLMRNEPIEKRALPITTKQPKK